MSRNRPVIYAAFRRFSVHFSDTHKHSGGKGESPKTFTALGLSLVTGVGFEPTTFRL